MCGKEQERTPVALERGGGGKRLVRVRVCTRECVCVCACRLRTCFRVFVGVGVWYHVSGDIPILQKCNMPNKQ